MVAFKHKWANPFFFFFWGGGGGDPKNNIGMKRGVSSTCQQSFVSLAPIFVSLLALTSLC